MLEDFFHKKLINLDTNIVKPVYNGHSMEKQTLAVAGR